jgi:hypothetical protein
MVSAAAAVISFSTAVGAQTRVTVDDLGPGPSGRILQQVLAQPHRLVEPDTGWFNVTRGEQVSAALIVLGRSAAIAGSVEGDVVVVDGDLFVRPGAHIGGRAVAIGGGVYPSTLSLIGQGALSFRDNTFSITREPEGYRLAYVSLREHPSPPLLFPGVFGLRSPAYDRVNGLALKFGPAFSFARDRGNVDLLVTYRADLGKLDPSIDGNVALSRRSFARLRAGRGTFTNDSWIWSDFVNSLSSLVFGVDTRNYYRADRVELTVHRAWEWTKTQVEPFVGGLAERGWPVGPAVGEQRGPWSVRGRQDTLGMWRPNPVINDGTVTSALAGLGVQWQAQGLSFRGRSSAEVGLSTPLQRNFVQVTSDIDVAFPTFGEQEYALDVHWVTSPGDAPPAQRFAYLGGPGSLVFNRLLEMGGDELLLVDQRYSYPLQNVRVGILGMPTMLLRHRFGSAGLGKLPSFEQMLGVGVLLTFVRAELLVDPASGGVRGSVGLSFSR